MSRRVIEVDHRVSASPLEAAGLLAFLLSPFLLGGYLVWFLL